MESYIRLTNRIEELELIGARLSEFSRRMIADEITAIKAVRDNLACEVFIN
jgi:hypothetical protein